MAELELLSSVPIFSELSRQALEELDSYMTLRVYRRNNLILMEDEFGDTLFIIKKGGVKITRVSEDGREVILAMLGAGEFFGEMSLLDGESRSANVVSLSDSEVVILKRRDFVAILERYPKVAIALLRELAQRIRRSDQQIESLSLSDAEHRIGLTLLRLAQEMGRISHGAVEIKPFPFQQDIANMAGTSRETVSRMFRLLEKRKLIERRGRTLRILDFGQFRRAFS